jgi:hypothetical protein
MITPSARTAARLVIYISSSAYACLPPTQVGAPDLYNDGRRFPEPAARREWTGIPGWQATIAMTNDVSRTWVDVIRTSRVPAGSHSDAVKVKYDDFARVVRPTVGDSGRAWRPPIET